MLFAPSNCNGRHEAMSYSLVEAATACGVNRSTVLRAISRQRRARRVAHRGGLHRVYPPVQTHEAHSEKAHQDALTSAYEVKAVVLRTSPEDRF
jgi:hypothetical protein